MSQTDKRTDLFVRLQSALDATAGFLTWADIAWGLQRAIERKKQESINALLAGLPLTDLRIAEEVAHREMGFSAKPEKAVEVISDKPTTGSTNKKRRTR